ncbi:histamine H2 receptor-like isoform X2 [Homarus americanus]|uniref:histamine H2 receptor-like isoform X2 n=1 Tax=Homarus americanus TaxID=6706 RepID=UPI001C47E92F|nr:histamine H2 receptor-like isoform X2 [Homarus americanus]
MSFGGANLRYGVIKESNRTGTTAVFECHPGGTTEAAIILALGVLGMSANIVLMTLLIARKHLRRWSQGLLFHQAMVDCGRAAILIPLGRSIYSCQPVTKCSLVETAFLLLVTVSTINMLTTVLSQVLNDAPLLPEDSDHKMMPLLMESPQCVLFGTFMIWFASITINLGPTFLSGALAANIDEEHNAPSCPLITGPLRHYVLNVLWIIINVLVLLLTVYHLYKLYRDLSTSSLEAVRIASLVTTMISVTQPQNQDPESREHHQVNNYITRMEREGVERVKMFVVVTVAYVVFWGPLFLVTLLTPSGGKTGLSHEVTLHVAYVHAFVNPALFLALHKGLRKAVTDIMCCHCSSHDEQTNRAEGLAGLQPNMTTSRSSLGGGLTGVLGGPMSASGALSGGLSTSGLSGATALSTAAAQAMPPYSSDGDITPPPFSSINRQYLFNEVNSSPSSLRGSHQDLTSQHRLHMATPNKNSMNGYVGSGTRESRSFGGGQTLGTYEKRLA